MKCWGTKLRAFVILACVIAGDEIKIEHLYAAGGVVVVSYLNAQYLRSSNVAYFKPIIIE